MDRKIGRRGLLRGGLVAGVGLCVSQRALAQVLSEPLIEPIGNAAAAFTAREETSTARPAVPSPLTPYQRRILDVAARERDRAGDKLWRKDLVGVADFALPSWRPRLHFADLEGGTVRSFLLAHGRGSDPEHSGWLQRFSNEIGSEATSRGSYLTCEWYKGKYGTSIRLEGMDGDNSMALDRAIVMHSAWYVDEAMVAKWGKIGRSEGCFAMSQESFNEALWHLSGGRLLFADRIGDA